MWLEHPNLPGQLIEVEDESLPHLSRSGWLEADAPAEPTTAELDARLLARPEPEPEAEVETEPTEPPPDESADETELLPESDE